MHSVDVRDLCRALQNLLRVVTVSSPATRYLRVYERVVWRDVLAQFGLVPDPRLCFSKPTTPKVCEVVVADRRVAGGAYTGTIWFEAWDLWWWHRADSWRIAVMRYRDARSLVTATFVPFMRHGGVLPRQASNTRAAAGASNGIRAPRFRRAAAPRAASESPDAAEGSHSGAAARAPPSLPDPPARLATPDGFDELRMWIELNLNVTEHSNSRTGGTTYSYFVHYEGGNIYKARKHQGTHPCVSSHRAKGRGTPQFVCAGQARPPKWGRRRWRHRVLDYCGHSFSLPTASACYDEVRDFFGAGLCGQARAAPCIPPPSQLALTARCVRRLLPLRPAAATRERPGPPARGGRRATEVRRRPPRHRHRSGRDEHRA